MRGPLSISVCKRSNQGKMDELLLEQLDEALLKPFTQYREDGEPSVRLFPQSSGV